MPETNRALVERIMALPMLQAEWVLWLLFALSAVSLGIILERAAYFARRRVDVDGIHARLSEAFGLGALADVAESLKAIDALETNVLLSGLRAAPHGPDAVEEMVRATLSREKQRAERALTLLAIVGSNAPFVGLFGTVLGIIHAFASLSTRAGQASQAVMAGVSEALVATAVGLLVAIPAVAAFSFFKARVRKRVEGADQLVRMLQARLKSDLLAVSDRHEAAA